MHCDEGVEVTLRDVAFVPGVPCDLRSFNVIQEENVILPLPTQGRIYSVGVSFSARRSRSYQQTWGSCGGTQVADFLSRDWDAVMLAVSQQVRFSLRVPVPTVGEGLVLLVARVFPTVVDLELHLFDKHERDVDEPSRSFLKPLTWLGNQTRPDILNAGSSGGKLPCSTKVTALGRRRCTSVMYI